jgi:hypothetical protein
MIGYMVDLYTKRIGLSPKCLDCTFWAFFEVDETGPVNLKCMERLASFGSRYSRICRAMRPFCVYLYASYTGRRNVNATFSLLPEAQLTIKLWRAVLCCSYYEDGVFTREIASFRPRHEGVVVEFDASLSGIGVLIYQRDSEGLETCMGGGAVSLEAGGFGDDSSFQNTAEFIGATVGVAFAISLGIKDQTITLRGDSMSALVWCEEERYRGFNVSNASVVYTMLSCASRLSGSMEHIEAAANWRTDKLSRRDHWGNASSTRQVWDGWGPRFAGARVLDEGYATRINQLVGLCLPGSRFDTDTSFADFWKEVQGVVSSMCSV